MAQQLSEMRMMQEQVQKDLEMMRAERRQFLAMQRLVVLFEGKWFSYFQNKGK